MQGSTWLKSSLGQCPQRMRAIIGRVGEQRTSGTPREAREGVVGSKWEVQFFPAELLCVSFSTIACLGTRIIKLSFIKGISETDQEHHYHSWRAKPDHLRVRSNFTFYTLPGTPCRYNFKLNFDFRSFLLAPYSTARYILHDAVNCDSI